MLKQEKKLHSKVKSYLARNNTPKPNDLLHRIQKRFRQEYWADIENIICPTQATHNDKAHSIMTETKETFLDRYKAQQAGLHRGRIPLRPRNKQAGNRPVYKSMHPKLTISVCLSPRMPSKLTTPCADATKHFCLRD